MTKIPSPKGHRPIRLLVLYTRLSAHIVRCLVTFQERTNADVLIYAWNTDLNAPFDESIRAAGLTTRSRQSRSDGELTEAAKVFAPDVVLVSGWWDKGYVSACRAMKKMGVPVVSLCDTQWTGSLRQNVAVLAAPLYVKKFIDVLWVTGDRQRRLANALGYRGRRCWDGFYACDVDAFATTADRTALPPAFLFVGRYVPEKGIDTMVAAYAAYRAQVSQPWQLVCAGAGPMRDKLIACGAQDQGFIQPPDLPPLMAKATALVLPSTFEPWGVVLQEAAAAGLPLIASHACGASVHLLRTGYNGFAFEAGDIGGLTGAMLAMHHATAAERAVMGAGSAALARQYTPKLWAKTLERGLSTFGQS